MEGEVAACALAGDEHLVQVDRVTGAVLDNICKAALCPVEDVVYVVKNVRARCLGNEPVVGVDDDCVLRRSVVQQPLRKPVYEGSIANYLYVVLNGRLIDSKIGSRTRHPPCIRNMTGLASVVGAFGISTSTRMS